MEARVQRSIITRLVPLSPGSQHDTLLVKNSCLLSQGDYTARRLDGRGANRVSHLSEHCAGSAKFRTLWSSGQPACWTAHGLYHTQPTTSLVHG